jgi:uncharacterized protein YggU (UPF0235/DUF167 family)
VGPGDEPGLVVRVGERAVDGRATEAALRALAVALGLRRRDVRLVHGAASRTKLVELDAGDLDERTLRHRIETLRENG